MVCLCGHSGHGSVPLRDQASLYIPLRCCCRTSGQRKVAWAAHTTLRAKNRKNRRLRSVVWSSPVALHHLDFYMYLSATGLLRFSPSCSFVSVCNTATFALWNIMSAQQQWIFPVSVPVSVCIGHSDLCGSEIKIFLWHFGLRKVTHNPLPGFHFPNFPWPSNLLPSFPSDPLPC